MSSNAAPAPVTGVYSSKIYSIRGRREKKNVHLNLEKFLKNNRKKGSCFPKYPFILPRNPGESYPLAAFRRISTHELQWVMVKVGTQIIKIFQTKI